MCGLGLDELELGPTREPRKGSRHFCSEICKKLRALNMLSPMRRMILLIATICCLSFFESNSRENTQFAMSVI